MSSAQSRRYCFVSYEYARSIRADVVVIIVDDDDDDYFGHRKYAAAAVALFYVVFRDVPETTVSRSLLFTKQLNALRVFRLLSQRPHPPSCTFSVAFRCGRLKNTTLYYMYRARFVFTIFFVGRMLSFLDELDNPTGNNKLPMILVIPSSSTLADRYFNTYGSVCVSRGPRIRSLHDDKISLRFAPIVLCGYSLSPFALLLYSVSRRSRAQTPPHGRISSRYAQNTSSEMIDRI